MKKILKIAQREFVETAKTKTFILGLVLVPLFVGGAIFISSRASGKKAGVRPPLVIDVTDLSGEVFAAAKSGPFTQHNQQHPERKINIQQLTAGTDPNATFEQAKEKLRQGKIDAYVIIDPNVMTDKVRMYVHQLKAADEDIVGTAEYLFKTAISNRRCQIKGVSRKLLDTLQPWTVSVDRIEVGKAEGQERLRKEKDKVAGFMAPFFFMYLMFMGMIGTGQHMVTSVIEEKGSRVIEVLLSAVSPFELMAGKIVGLACIGLTVVAIWGSAAMGAVKYHGMDVNISPQMMAYFAVYYIPGFLIFCSLLAAVGSICNTVKETQGLMMPVMLVFVLPLMIWFKLVQDPTGTLARGLSFIPPLTPMVMILRLSAGANISPVEIAATIVLLVVSAVFALWAAAKVFRTGILMYGKRPALREVLRWLRQN